MRWFSWCVRARRSGRKSLLEGCFVLRRHGLEHERGAALKHFIIATFTARLSIGRTFVACMHELQKEDLSGLHIATKLQHISYLLPYSIPNILILYTPSGLVAEPFPPSRVPIPLSPPGGAPLLLVPCPAIPSGLPALGTRGPPTPTESLMLLP